jgi:putative oxygen-independent coproporphyrinogen III oxidase
MYDWTPGGFGIYLHWPFCQSKCPYCDFNSHVAESVDQTAWKAAFLSEIDRYADEVGQRTLQTIYFGGGTPSLMEPELVAAIIDKIRSRWPTVNDIEVTLEANPSSVEAGRFEGFRDAGVNRVSIGIQALNDRDLRRLGRLHSRAEALRALDIAKNTFQRVTFDLIYSRQDQSTSEWEAELSEALSFADGHLSLYQLTVEDGTVFAARAARGQLSGLPMEEQAAEMFELTQAMCGSAGLPAYEISNHAKPGSESRHNAIYWQAGDYVGVGPGAHGRITVASGRLATESFRNPNEWLDQVKRLSSGESVRTKLSSKDISLEYLLMSLRTSQGMSLKRYDEMAGLPLDFEKVASLVAMGLLESEKQTIRVTDSGRLLLNGILRELAPD